MNKELGKFTLRVGDLEIHSVPQVIDYVTIPNHHVFMDLVKYFNDGEKERSVSLGYFKYLGEENCWEFQFLGDKPFKEISSKEEIQTVWVMLQMAYDILQTNFVN